MVAEHKLAIFAAEVHAATLAVAPEFTGVARLLLAHPLAITVRFEAMLPDLPEVVLVDVALVVLAAYAGASRDATVNQDGGYADTRSTLEDIVADLHFVVGHKALAGIRYMQSLFAFEADVIEHLAVLLGCE